MSYELHCSSCGKKLLKYEKFERKYKSPVESCKKCGQEYIDPRCREMAVEGFPNEEFSVKGRIVLLIVGGLIAWRGMYLFQMRILGVPDGMQWLTPAIILLLGVALVCGAIIDMISIFSGRKKRKYDRLMQESAERMKDEAYAEKLKKLGYMYI